MANVNPISGVEFGKERTSRQMRDRAQWEHDQAAKIRAAKRPIGWEHIVDGHENVARAYEQAARKREHAESGAQPSRSRGHAAVKAERRELKDYQLAALRTFAQANGRNWKSALNDAWSTGRYRNYNGADDEGALQEIRNYFGPSWLVRFSFNKPSAQVRTHATRRSAPTFTKFDERRGDEWFPLWKFREMIVDGRVFDEDGSGHYGKLNGSQRLASNWKVDLSRFATKESFDRQVPTWAKGVVWRSRRGTQTSHARTAPAFGEPKYVIEHTPRAGYSKGAHASYRSKQAAIKAAKWLANQKNGRVEVAHIDENHDRHFVTEVYPSGR